MLRAVKNYLRRVALETISSHLEGEADAVVLRWLRDISFEIPRLEVSRPLLKAQGQRCVALLLATVRCEVGDTIPEHNGQIVEVGRSIAIESLAEGFSIAEVLKAMSLFRRAVLGEMEVVLRRRLWMVVPADFIEAQRRVNRALDMQMLAIAESYLQVRDDQIRQSQLDLEEANDQLLGLYGEAQRRTEDLSAVIQEMHHRIKNNLQTVVDLLTLQGQQQGCAVASKCLGDSIGRVKSIAAVHDLLIVDNIRQTDVIKLAQLLADIATSSSKRPNLRIRVSVEGSRIHLSSRQATCLALVLNELLDNAVEHAFPNVDEGEIGIELREDGPDAEIVVRDSGVGLGEAFDRARTGGLGLAIARSLVERDLMGSLTLAGSKGTEAFIRFPIALEDNGSSRG